MLGLTRYLKTRLRRLQNRYGHITAIAPDGRAIVTAGEALVMQICMSRNYLGNAVSPTLKRGWHARNPAPAFRRLAHRHGLAVYPANSNRPEDRPDALIIPRYVCLSIDLPETYEAYVKGLVSSAKNDLRILKKRGFQIRLTRDPAHLAHFHTHFHTPSVKSRFGAEAYAASLAELTPILEADGGELVQVFKGDQWVAASLASKENDAYRLHRLGWLNGDPELRRQGVIAALYQSRIQRTFELGLRKLILGGTLPFLDDGVFAYKAKWGAHVDAPATTYNNWVWHLNPEHPHLRHFLQTHTIIARGEKGRLVAYSAHPPLTDHAYAPTMTSLSAWYRLLTSPDADIGTKHPEVPANLRPWFASDALESTSTKAFQMKL